MIKNNNDNSISILDDEIKILRQSELFLKSKNLTSNELLANYIKLTENYGQLISKFQSYIANYSEIAGYIEEPVQKHEIDLNLIIVDTVDLLIQNARKKNLVIKTNLHDKILLEYEDKMLRTICRHLISNAIKYSFTGGLIEITTQINKDFVEFVVIDNGTGISKENLKKIFAVDSGLKTLGTAGEKGTGLGLIICKNYVEQSGGKLNVISEIGKGCRFEVFLPK